MDATVDATAGLSGYPSLACDIVDGALVAGRHLLASEAMRTSNSLLEGVVADTLTVHGGVHLHVAVAVNVVDHEDDDDVDVDATSNRESP